MTSPKNYEDRIKLSGVLLRPRIGVTRGERRQPQSCEADVLLWGDFEAAGTTDSLDRAIDYCEVLEVVLATAHEQEFNLVEALANRLARRILESFPAQRVEIRVRKQPSTIQDKVHCIEVQLNRP